MFYSQFGQDEYLSKLFPKNYKGTCIEIGAYDGIRHSNTYYFENKGWNCLCIEGNYEKFNICKNVRKNCLNYCISNEDNNDKEFIIYNLEDGNQSEISSLKPDNRLIDLHKNLIIESKKQKVKTITLTTILNEINFLNDIDFITIDTENTEIDVLNGINFDIYNIKYILLENNFNENKCEDFLRDKGYKKIDKIGVDDLFEKDQFNFEYCKIKKYFKINSAYYHIYNKLDEFNCNVTDIVLNHFKEYIKDKSKNILNISNKTFDDKCIILKNKLYLNYQSIFGEQCLILNESENLDWNNLLDSLLEEYIHYKYPENKNYYNNNEINNINNISNLSNLSIGEVLYQDTYNIIKKNNINNFKNVIDLFNLKYKKLYKKYDYFLNILSYFIYLYDNAKKSYDELNFDDLSNDNLINIKNITFSILENEKKINRIINYLNNFIKINIYNNLNLNNTKILNNKKSEIYILINDEFEIVNKIPELNYLFIEYDILYFDIKYKETINSIFKNTNTIFENHYNLNSIKSIELNKCVLNDELKLIYTFNPIRYISSGRLGDFFNSLSVINENFYKTGRKGVLYITDKGGDRFREELKDVYNQLYDIVKNQIYISEFKIHNNEEYDINLSDWREIIKMRITDHDSFYSWKNMYGYCFNIDNWGEHKWLNNIYYDNKWSDKIIINITPYRPARNIGAIRQIIDNNKNNIIFITFDTFEYEYFINNYGLNRNEVNMYLLKSLPELFVIINSSKYAYLGISSFATIANSLHKKHSMFYSQDVFANNANNMVNILPHMLEFI